MLRGRRVGTLTAGIVLVLFGILFLLRSIFSSLNFTVILSLWPIILIILGIEIILAYTINKEEQMKYDGGAIILVIGLSLFSMVMAGAEFAIANFPKLRVTL